MPFSACRAGRKFISLKGPSAYTAAPPIVLIVFSACPAGRRFHNRLKGSSADAAAPVIRPIVFSACPAGRRFINRLKGLSAYPAARPSTENTKELFSNKYKVR